MRRFLPLAFLIGLSGCASYTYRLIEPGDARQEVVKKADLVVPLPPVEYRMQRVENRVVLFIENRGSAPLSLDGGKSVVTDPSGQSHAVASQLLPPGNFVKMILPPMPAYREPRGPTFQIGVGTGFHVQADDAGGPLYLAAYDDDWTWKDGTVRLTLTFTRDDGGSFTHRLAIEKTKD